MKKKATGLLLALSMVLSFACPAGAANLDSGNPVLLVSDLAKIDDTIEIPGADGSGALTQQEAAAFTLRRAGMKTSQLGSYPDDYNAMAKSAGIVDGTFDPEAPCTEAMLAQMWENAQPLYQAINADKKQPLFVNGEAQPIFEYTSGMASDDEYSNEDSNIIRYPVYVETNYDTDGDGKLDLVKALVQLPRAAAEGDYKAATIYEARPYITGCTEGVSIPYGEDGYDIGQMYSQPAARGQAGAATTMEAAAQAKASDWYFLSPYESAAFGEFYDYEDLDWYDYFLVRGYAVVEVGGLGTRGSEGFETCGTDLETDAFKCVVEWLTGDRVAYTDKENNIAIKADWSNGKVGMTGRSYGGTTDFSVAATGVKGLETIVPVAGIASWYEYTNSQGISTGRNPAYSDDLAFYCAGRYIDDADYAAIAEDYGNYLGQIRDDQLALNGDYGGHWANRDYTTADGKIDGYNNFSCPALIVHGLNDDNVRTKQFELMYHAFQDAGQNVKLLLHQGAHITPDYDSHKTSLPIGGASYNGILNKWFSHYLYGQDNGAEDMAAVTVQSNVDGSWTTLDQWESSGGLTLACAAEQDATTIHSDIASIGVTSRNWKDKFTAGSTGASAMYTMDVAADTTIQGAAAVHIKAAPTQYYTASAEAPADEAPAAEAPRGSDHEEIMNPANRTGEMADVPMLFSERASRDALMMSAMLVDIADEPFDTFGTSVTEVKTGESSWVGGGVQNYDVIRFKTTPAKYKIIARGWMDLANPAAGYDSASAADKIELEDGVYNDYTLYLQPNRYTVKAGHKLALVIYTYEPGKASYAQNYAITIDNAASYAEIPVNDSYSLTYSAGENGAVTADYESGCVVAANTRVTLAATPDSGYRFDGWTVNGEKVSGEATRTFVITENTTITANFARKSSGGHSGGGSGGSSGGNTGNNGGSTGTTGGSNDAWTNPFTDVKSGDWYYDAVKYASEKGVMSGTAAGKFSPNLSTTRGMIVTILWRQAGSPVVNYQMTYDDVNSESYYAEAVRWAASEKVVSGYSDSKFGPDDTITREQMASILYRYAQLQGMEAVTLEENLAGFADEAQISAYAIPALNWAVGKSLMSGKGNSTLDPKGTATRAEAATVLMKFADLAKE